MAVALPLARSRGSLRFLAAIALAPALLGISRLLPDGGVGLGLRLAAAAAIVLILPGALLLRTLGWPASPALAAVAAFAWSLAIVFFALMVTFAAGASLTLAVAVLGICSLAVLLPAATAGALPRVGRSEWLALLGVLGAGAVFAGVVWWASRETPAGDALFHLARARKLEEFDALGSVRAVREFGDGGLHPGYAFPLWHGVLALVARLAAVDVTQVVEHLGAVLVPLAFVVAYAAGRALFRSWAGGVAALAAQVAQLGFARDGIGSFEVLALPATASRVLLVPTVLALAFALAGGGSWGLLGALGAAGLALTVVHPTYALFLALPLAGFLVVRLAIAPRDWPGHLRIAAPLPALIIPLVGYTIWILPVLNSTISRGEDDRARAIEHYAGQLDVSGDTFRLAPEAIARGGPAVVAALLAVPLAVLAGRRLWAAVVLGGTLAILAVVLLPTLFTPFADAVSVSQGRRLVLFLPLAFALAGAAVLLGRFRWIGAAAALGVGVLLQALFPGQLDYAAGEGGPAWAVWLALFGGIAAFAAAARLRWRGPEPGVFAAIAAVAFVLPIAVTGLADAHREERPDPYALSPGLVRELSEIDRRHVVFSNLETSYRIAAYVKVRIAAAPPAHVARTKLNRPYERRRAVVKFFFHRSTSDKDRREILVDFAASWVVVDKTRRYPAEFLRFLHRTYEDDRYALYRVGPT